jgi:hypothetical protein
MKVLLLVIESYIIEKKKEKSQKTKRLSTDIGLRKIWKSHGIIFHGQVT